MAAAAPAAAAVSAAAHDDFTLTHVMVEIVANFLVRIALFAADSKEAPVQRLSARCVALFRAALGAWGEHAPRLRFAYLEKLLASPIGDAGGGASGGGAATSRRARAPTARAASSRPCCSRRASTS